MYTTFTKFKRKSSDNATQFFNESIFWKCRKFNVVQATLNHKWNEKWIKGSKMLKNFKISLKYNYAIQMQNFHMIVNLYKALNLGDVGFYQVLTLTFHHQI